MVKVTGLRELRAHLRAADRKLPKVIGKAGKEAAWLVARIARPRVPTGPAKGGHARMSIKPSVTQSGAAVQEGGAKYSYMPWLDMGGKIHPRENQEIYRPWIGRKGRYIWAAFAENKNTVLDLYMDALDRGLREAGLDVR
jgi:hypothetical protein